MTELPPIIDRLDAKRPSEPGKANYLTRVSDWHAEVGEAYDELKRELLRLQEERDRANLHIVDLEERLMGRPYEDLLAAVEQRDALLEALKAKVEGWRGRVEREDAIHRANPYGLGGSYSRPIEACIDDIEDIITDVEGKDG